VTNPVIVQGIGVAAVIIAVTIFQTNNRKTMLRLGMCGCALWSLHFFLLGATTGSLMNLIGVGRAYAFYRIDPSGQNRWVLWSFLGLLTAVSIITWQGPISLLPLLGSGINVIAYWQKRPKIIRRLAFNTSPPWLIYNIISGSYPGIAVEILKMTSNLIGQYRFDIRPVKTPAASRLRILKLRQTIFR
jgi:Bacterial inner membrane protein